VGRDPFQLGHPRFEIHARRQTAGGGRGLQEKSPRPRDADEELNPPRTFGKVPEYNAIAEKVMKENGLAIDDLNAAIIPRIAGLQSTKDMHFKSEGSAFLAKGRCRVVTACRRHERSVPCEPFHMTYIVRCFLYAPFVRLFPWL
jgi:hypothetical protein